MKTRYLIIDVLLILLQVHRRILEIIMTFNRLSNILSEPLGGSDMFLEGGIVNFVPCVGGASGTGSASAGALALRVLLRYPR
jgi:hypothetical protein